MAFIGEANIMEPLKKRRKVMTLGPRFAVRDCDYCEYKELNTSDVSAYFLIKISIYFSVVWPFCLLPFKACLYVSWVSLWRALIRKARTNLVYIERNY